MKAVELGKDAASAEMQRLQRMGLRFAQRLAFLVIAALFGLFMLISAHVLLWVVCFGPWHTGKVWASVIVLGVDIVFAGIFALLGRGKPPSSAEIEARMTRDRSLAAMRNAFALSAVTATVVGPAGRMAGRGVADLFRSRMRKRRERGRFR
jgi:hypothetical protein